MAPSACIRTSAWASAPFHVLGGRPSPLISHQARHKSRLLLATLLRVKRRNGLRFGQSTSYPMKCRKCLRAALRRPLGAKRRPPAIPLFAVGLDPHARTLVFDSNQ